MSRPQKNLIQARWSALWAKLVSLGAEGLRAADSETLALSYGLPAEEVALKVAEAIKIADAIKARGL